MKSRNLFVGLALLSALAATGCAGTYQSGPSYNGPSYNGPSYNTRPASPINANQNGRATVVSVERMGKSGTSGKTILGTAAGGVTGGLIGSQIGRGSGRTAATIAGAASGALIGHSLTKNRSHSGEFYRMTVRFENGSKRSFDYSEHPQVSAGDRVRVEGDQVYRR